MFSLKKNLVKTHKITLIYGEKFSFLNLSCISSGDQCECLHNVHKFNQLS